MKIKQYGKFETFFNSFNFEAFLQFIVNIKLNISFRYDIFLDLWPNLKNLSGGLNLSRGLNMVGSTSNCIKCLKI